MYPLNLVYLWISGKTEITNEKCYLSDVDLYAHVIKMLATIYG